jgi:hypothetical protein
MPGKITLQEISARGDGEVTLLIIPAVMREHYVLRPIWDKTAAQPLAESMTDKFHERYMRKQHAEGSQAI